MNAIKNIKTMNNCEPAVLFLLLSKENKPVRSGQEESFTLSFFSAALACLGWPPKGFYLFLDKKVAKNQGLELMLDKSVKALFRQHKHPMKNRERTRCLG